MVSSGFDSLYKISLQKKCEKLHTPISGCGTTSASNNQLLFHSELTGGFSSLPIKGASGHWPLHGEPFIHPGTFLSSLNLCKTEAAPLGQPLF